MTTTCQSPNIYRACKLGNISITFALPTLSMMSVENGCHGNMVQVPEELVETKRKKLGWGQSGGSKHNTLLMLVLFHVCWMCA